MVMVALIQHHMRGNSLVDALVLDEQVYHRRSNPIIEHAEWAGLNDITSLIQFSDKQTCVMPDASCISQISAKLNMLVGSVICGGLFPTISYLVKLFRYILECSLGICHHRS